MVPTTSNWRSLQVLPFSSCVVLLFLVTLCVLSLSISLSPAKKLPPVDSAPLIIHLQNMPAKKGRGKNVRQKKIFADNPARTNMCVVTTYDVPGVGDSDSYKITRRWSETLNPVRVDSYVYAHRAGTLRETKVRYVVSRPACMLTFLRSSFFAIVGCEGGPQGDLGTSGGLCVPCHCSDGESQRSNR